MTIAMSGTTATLSAERRAIMKRRSVSTGAGGDLDPRLLPV